MKKEPEQKIDLDILYLLAEISGFLSGLATDIEDMRIKETTLEYAKRLKKIVKDNLL